MHGFNLAMKDIVAYPAAKEAASSLQRIVAWFRNSHQAGALLRAERKRDGLQPRALVKANRTRFTSLLDAISSLLDNRQGCCLRSASSR